MLSVDTAGARPNFITVAARILSATLLKAAVICLFAIGFAGEARAGIFESDMSIEEAVAESIACLEKFEMHERAYLLSTIGSDIHATDEEGYTILHHVSSCGSADAVMALLKAGADVNAAVNNKNTPLHFAIQNPNVAVISVLIQAGADVNANSRNPPLHSAAFLMNAYAISVLIQAGADVNAVGSAQHTPIHDLILGTWSCQYVTQKKWTSDAPSAASILANHDANINRTDKNGRTPLDSIYFNASSVKEGATCATDRLNRKIETLFKIMTRILKSAGAVCNKNCEHAK